MGIGRIIDEAVIESTGLDIGPTTAFHHLPQSDSESLEISAEDDIAAIKPGVKIKEACSLLSSEIPDIKAYESRIATIEGVILPIVSTGFLSSVLRDHENSD
tara:strand:+ start:78 stop:383 length:306 start_codon:yes stop_codon:yes gene_type:complete